MTWIFIALLSGNLVTSQHASEETCLGRKAIFDKEYKASSKCVEVPAYNYGSVTLSPAYGR